MVALGLACEEAYSLFQRYDIHASHGGMHGESYELCTFIVPSLNCRACTALPAISDILRVP